MGNFNKGGFGGGKKFGGGGRGGDRGGNRGGFGGGRGGDRERAEMHRATCDECGKACEVPFRPSGDKPVFCSDCFETKRDGGNDRGDRGGDRGDRGNRSFDSRDSKPRFSDRRPSKFEGEAKGAENLKPQLIQINETLNKILKALSASDSTVSVQSTEQGKGNRHEKAPRKEVNIAELKDTIEKAMETKAPAKKTAPKKTVATPAKKVVAKKVAPKKVAPKKVAAKKATPAKKAVAKKK